MKTKITLVLSMSLFAMTTFAQQADKQVTQKFKDENGMPSLITFNEKSNYKASDSNQIFKEQLGLKPNQDFNLLKTETDELGFTHQKFQLFEQSIKVEFATYTLHSKNGKIVSMSGEFYKDLNTITTAFISEQEAFNKAIEYTGAKQYLWDNAAEAKFMNYQKPTGELVLLPNMSDKKTESVNDNLRLAYKFDIYATKPLSRGDLYIDANNGEVLYFNATIKHIGEFAHGTKCSESHIVDKPSEANTILVAGNAATRYSGTQSIQTLLSGSSYILLDNTRGIGIETKNCNKLASYFSPTSFTDVDNNWTAAEFDNNNKDNAALDAHWGTEKTYDYFKNIHNRNSYDNAGAKIFNFVHYSVNFDNAFWDGQRMTYGDGSGAYFNALTSLDITAHEIGHGICEKTANLAYQKESGALNEGFSDIWAACVEYYAAPTKSTWLIGEDIMFLPGPFALRSMSNPKSYNKPDTFGGTFWSTINCGVPAAGNDYCGVHSNSFSWKIRN
jgi:bacillolysin